MDVEVDPSPHMQVRPGAMENDPYEVRRYDPVSGEWSEWIELSDFIGRTRGEAGRKEVVKQVKDMVRADREQRTKAPVPIATGNTILKEKIDHLRTHLQQHPGTRLMDLEQYRDAERGPLFIMAKKLLQRGELFEHPKTKALSFKQQRPSGEGLGRPEIMVNILEDLPDIAGRGTVYCLKAGDVAALPESIARTLIKRGKAEEVLDIREEVKNGSSATSRPFPGVEGAAHQDQESETATEGDEARSDDDRPPLTVDPLPSPPAEPVAVEAEALTIVNRPSRIDSVEEVEEPEIVHSHDEGKKATLPKHRIRIIDLIPDVLGELSVQAEIDGVTKKWRYEDLETELHQHPQDYPPLSLEMLRDKRRMYLRPLDGNINRSAPGKKVEEAAIAAKRREDAPRVEARDLKTEEETEADLAALRDGSWWGVVDGAIDEFLAGEPYLRKVIVYSALSAGIHGMRLHLIAIGDSQVGKSYALRSIGSKLFPDLFIDVAAMSAKALYYAADEAGNPRLFDGKILFVDELSDQGDGTLDFIKAAMSHGAEKLTSMTVDEHRKSKIQSLEGVPIVWSTSAEVLEDALGQIMNRPFVVNPDESAEQTRKILDFQREAASIGLVKASVSRIPQARRLLARILEEKDLTVYNLFAHHVKIGEADARARNTLPMFFDLVNAIAYAHRFARPVIELPDGRKLLFASWQDNVEAAELWEWAIGPKSTGLPNRHIELLKILPVFAGSITGGLEVDDILEIYKANTGRPVSHKTIRNYLADLSSKDKATYYEAEDGRHLWYSTGSSHTFPTVSHLLIGLESKEGDRLLDEALRSLEDALSQLPNEIRKRAEGLREKVLNGRGA